MRTPSTSFSAQWVLPIGQPPIARGRVSCADGRIVAVERGNGGAVDLGRVALMPALVNAHTHLELSYLRGRIGPSPRFVDWVRTLLSLRRDTPDPRAPHVVAAATLAFGEAVSSGTGVFGDVSNTLVTPLLSTSEPGAEGVVFLEVLGFRSEDAAARMADARRLLDGSGGRSVRVSLAPHAPYSVSPALFRAIRGELDKAAGAVTTVHLAESLEEVQLLRDGTGPWRQALEDLGAWDASWQPPGTSPVAYARDLGFIAPSVLVVHGVQCSQMDIDALAASGATVVVCPRSNRHVGVGDPPIAAFYRAEVPVAIGTDSLVSAPDLNMFEEMAQVRRVAPDVPARRILESATRVGARALGCGDRQGHIAVGAAPGLIAVAVPEGVIDVEEYLVSGIGPERVSWVWSPHHGSGPS